ncbi:hypothetical protein ACIGEP_11580 [Microbacterium sp. NPDC077663]|uniref:hypothetical protein n=1 Tax=Microbacterium sp. NPDC077663 TaxID=3364189 RepID=UPI0037C8E55B
MTHPLSAAVMAVLSDVDPYALEPGGNDGCPVDEYEPETSAFAGVLIRRGRVTVEDVDRIWQRWFSETLTGLIGPVAVGDLLARLNGLPRT